MYCRDERALGSPPGPVSSAQCWFDGRPIREEYLIVDGGQLAGAGAHSNSASDGTGGSEEAARFQG
jgi:formate dehydrogenase